MSKSGVYEIFCHSDGKRYIGSSVNIKKRKRSHFDRLMKNQHTAYLQNAYNKYGKDSFEFNILIICNKDMLIEYEQRLIDGYDSYKNGFNCRPKAENNLGAKLSPETCEKMSKSRKGLTISEEQKIQISKVHKNKVVSAETREKISKASKGRIPWNKGIKTHRRSDEVRKAMSISQKKRWEDVSEEDIDRRTRKTLSARTSQQRSESAHKSWETRRRRRVEQFQLSVV